MEQKMTISRGGIIKNAKMASKRDGYPQVIYLENDGSYTFTRLYTNLQLFNVGRVIAFVDGDILYDTEKVKDYENCQKIYNKYNITIK